MLMANQVDVPLGFVIPISTFLAWENNGQLTAAAVNTVAAAYDELVVRTGNPGVAVRSSAIDEDSSTSSFAGQYVTHLNVAGLDALIESTVDCWRSYRSPRIESYRAARGLGAAEGMAVIIQEMAEPRVAGVMFTRHPVDNRPLYVIEAIAGSGAPIVNGSVIPERVIVNPDTMDVVEHIIPGTERIMTYKDIDQLVHCGHDIEHICGRPLDIEWVIGSRVQILQARPITA
jgi:pyruvate,water dikinase